MTISNSTNDIIKYQAGIDLQKNTAKGKRILNNYQEQNNYAFFHLLNIHLTKILVYDLLLE